jgi:Tfp pilus assembly protein PilV
VVLAIAVVGVATTIAASHQQSAALEEDSIAVAAARQLMEEIAAKPLVGADATPGYGAGQKDRAQYDTINDYDGMSETAPVTTLEGVKMTIGTQPFVRAVRVTYPTSVFGTTTPAGEFALVEVTVKGPTGRDVSLKRLVARTTRER